MLSPLKWLPQCKLFGLHATCALLVVTCAGCGAHYSYQNVSVTLSPAVPSVQVNATQMFTAMASNAPDYPVWYLQYVSAGSPNAGSIATQSTDSPMMTYTAPPAPPIYNPTQIAAGAVQGSVTVLAIVSNDPTKLFSGVTASQTFVITAPTVTVSISTQIPIAYVGSVVQFTGYAVGSINNLLTWQVNGVTGGTPTTGTINGAGAYSAPAAIPITGNTITVTAVSQAQPAQSASIVVTLKTS